MSAAGDAPEIIDTIPINFVIAGVQKAATTTMFTLLDKHPAIAPNLKVDPHKAERKWWFGGKELHVLDDESRSWDPPDWTHYVATRTTLRQRLAVDATPSYLFWPQALDRLRDFDPGIRLVASFRDPIERTLSQWRMERSRRKRPYPPFAEAIRAFTDTALFDRVPPGASKWDVHRESLVIRGLYGRQLRQGLALFPREQWLLVTFEDFVGDYRAVLDRLCDHGGIARFSELSRGYPRLVHKETARDPADVPPTAADFEFLADFFAADLAEFAALSGLDTSRWTTARLLSGDLDVADLVAKHAARAG